MPNGWGGRIREIRKDQKLTQKEFAQHAKLSTSTIARLEHGKTKPRQATKEKLLAAFNKLSDRLFRMEDIPPEK